MAQPPRRGWSAKNEERAQEAGWSSYAEWVADVERELGRECCGAWARSRKAPCRRRTPHGRSRCHSHGGASLVGPDNPAARHLKYSEHVPQIMLGPYQRGLADSRLVSLEHELSLVDALIVAKLARWVDAGPPGRVRTIVGRMNAAREANDVGALRQAWVDLEEAVDGYVDADAQAEALLPLLEQRRKLSESQARLMQTAHEMVSREELTSFSRFTLDALTRALEQHVPNEGQRRRVVASLARDLREAGGAAA